MNKISSVGDVYRFTSSLVEFCSANQAQALADALLDAQQLGSSGLEILGAIRKVLVDNSSLLRETLPPEYVEQMRDVIAFVDACYGR